MYAPSRAPVGAVTSETPAVIPSQVSPESRVTYFGREYSASDVNTVKNALSDIYSFMVDDTPSTTATKNGLAIPTDRPPSMSNAPKVEYTPAEPLDMAANGGETTMTSTPQGEKIKLEESSTIVIIVLLFLVIMMIFMELMMRRKVARMEKLIKHMEGKLNSPVHTPPHAMAYPNHIVQPVYYPFSMI